MPTKRDAVIATILEYRDSFREGREWTLDELDASTALIHDHETSREFVRDVLDGLADAGLLEESYPGDAFSEPRYSHPDPEPVECEWCSAPFPEARRQHIQRYDPDGRPYDEEHICAKCARERL